MNCWLQRTPLEVGLLLILIVSIPFLIGITTVYVALFMLKCPNCSISCEKVCANKTTNKSLLSQFIQLHPNVSLPRLAEKYEICPEGMLENFQQKVDHAFVASIIQDVYIDDITHQQYLCAGAIISFKWVITSSKCLPNNSLDVTGIFVRAGSNYWFEGGSVHSVQHLIFADHTRPATVVAIELKSEFPRLSSIRPVMLSSSSLYKNFGVADSFFWETNKSLPLAHRQKYATIVTEPHIIYKDELCANKTFQQKHLFCSHGIKPTNVSCMVRHGFPLTRAMILLGVNIGGYCDSQRNGTYYFIYDISHAINWLVKITGVYVEHL